jgi:hypothetical protein
MGAGETQLMHTLTTAAKKGWAYMEDDDEDRSGRPENGWDERRVVISFMIRTVNSRKSIPR